MSKVEETLSLLTPGSVWLSAKGVPSFVLCITNENVPAARQKLFPPQVVFADDEGELFSVGLERFLEHRTFHHVEYDLEQKIENLFVSEPKPEDETEGADDAAGVTDVVQQHQANSQSILELEEAAALLDLEKAKPATTRGLHSTFQFEHLADLTDPALNNIVLANALRSFSQEPNVTEQQLISRLTFLLDASVTIESLDETFNDTKVAAGRRRGVVAITVQSAGNIETILWDQYLGTYPVYTDGGAYGVVLLASDVTVEVAEDGDEVSPEAASELGTLMGDGSMPAHQPPYDNNPVNEQPAANPAEAFAAAIEQPEQQPAEQPVAPTEQQPVDAVQVTPPSAPVQNSGN